MRISDWSSDVCSSDLRQGAANLGGTLPFGISDPIAFNIGYEHRREYGSFRPDDILKGGITLLDGTAAFSETPPFTYNTDEIYGETIVPLIGEDMGVPLIRALQFEGALRSEEHTSELQSLMTISYADFCLKKKTRQLNK